MLIIILKMKHFLYCFRLSKADYQQLRNFAAKKDYKDLFPAYNHVRLEKEKCLPAGGIDVGDYHARVDLQELLHHTANRIVAAGVANLNDVDEGDDLVMISKIGFDGCTGQSVYKQLASEDVTLASIAVEESLFLTCMVPLVIINRSKNNEKVWINKQPSSTLFC